MKTTIAGVFGVAMMCMGFTGQPRMKCDITVRGEDSLLLKNVKILVVGSSVNVFTDAQGKATLPCAMGDIYVAAASGYKSVVDTVKSSAIEILMEKDTPKDKAKKSRKK